MLNLPLVGKYNHFAFANLKVCAGGPSNSPMKYKLKGIVITRSDMSYLGTEMFSQYVMIIAIRVGGYPYSSPCHCKEPVYRFSLGWMSLSVPFQGVIGTCLLIAPYGLQL